MLLSQSRIGRPQAAVAFRPAAAVRSVKVLAAAEVPALPAPVEPVSTDGKPKEGVARLRFQRGSVYKVRRVLDTMRGRSYEEALMLMEYMPYRACERILKALMSAAANAKHNNGALKTKLYVSECFADGGPYLERMRPRAQGRAYKIMKPTFHLTVKLEERA
ncbi:hypothetical protein QJQ45_021495 [Haematococcus lacustris]|nr:hypothetical protein QJQ45_021495 [Haematococcus lacustris]